MTDSLFHDFMKLSQKNRLFIRTIRYRSKFEKNVVNPQLHSGFPSRFVTREHVLHIDPLSSDIIHQLPPSIGVQV